VLEAAANEVVSKLHLVRSPVAEPATPSGLLAMKGLLAERLSRVEASPAVNSRQFDLVVVEDLGRIFRRNRADDFCELCEDAGTCLIAINDSIDTADENWRINGFVASFKHESIKKDTTRRIRRSLRNRFEEGGVIQSS
jgi:site-specific DNA recombinase